jgi:hypothetical protein
MRILMTRAAVISFSIVSLAGCAPLGPLLDKRDVRAVLTGPAEIVVGQSVDLTVTLEYSDGVKETQFTVDKVTLSVSDVSIGTIAKTRTQYDRGATVTGVAPGELTVTATPTPAFQSVGRLFSGTWTMRVVK